MGQKQEIHLFTHDSNTPHTNRILFQEHAFFLGVFDVPIHTSPVGVDVLQKDPEDRKPDVRDDHFLLVAFPHAGREHRAEVRTACCQESL